MSDQNGGKKENFLQFLPWWMWIAVALQLILVTFFIVATLQDPAALLPGEQPLDYLVVLYVTRNATALLGIIVAVLLRSHAALLIALVIRFSTDLIDIANVLSLGDKGGQAAIPFVIVLLVIPAVIGCIYLFRRIER